MPPVHAPARSRVRVFTWLGYVATVWLFTWLVYMATVWLFTWLGYVATMFIRQVGLLQLCLNFTQNLHTSLPEALGGDPCLF